ncbi:FAD-binding oxidoreductase [Nisaea acidiphila]|uniref:FAD-binding oxidoreductase n=1 Tax=Nisaea acidiphila TaxID=1862145 RepID=A0A9J7ASF4_9PROT|nr:FAD-dependent oxidoreductase [Nisaea acidiphila]UUX50579.1 FAD-binding oxidoreductase [Nisaea acidiphila]
MRGGSDVIVIGGGLVGSSIAYGLAREGASVTILDEGDVALRASRGNFGLVWVQGKGDGMHEYASWTRRSKELYQGFADGIQERDGTDIELKQDGGLELCLGEEEFRTNEDEIRRMHNQPGVGENDRVMLDADEVRRMLPLVGPEVTGASYSPHDGHVNPLYLLRGLHGNAQALGARYVSGGRVRHIEKDGGGFRVISEAGVFLGQKVVIAAGLANKWLAEMVGLDIPVEPNRGHILITERMQPVIPTLLVNARQTADGTINFGNSKESAGYSTRINPAKLGEIARSIIRCFPILKDARIVRTWSALRVMSPDGFPIYRESESMPGAFSISCHSGVTLAAAHALELAPVILGGRFNERFAAFSPERFRAASAA